MIKKNRLFWLLNISIPLIFGLFIYIKTSPTSIITMIINKIILVKTNDTVSFFTRLLRNYMCDFCWSYSMSYVIGCIYVNSDKRQMIIIIPSIAGICYEILQLFSVVNGTFDVVDIVTEITASIIAFIVINNRFH